MCSYRLGEEQIPGAGRQNSSSKATKVAIDRRQLRIFEVMPRCIALGCFGEHTVPRQKDVVNALIGVERVANLGDIGSRRPRCDARGPMSMRQL